MEKSRPPYQQSSPSQGQNSTDEVMVGLNHLNALFSNAVLVEVSRADAADLIDRYLAAGVHTYNVAASGAPECEFNAAYLHLVCLARALAEALTRGEINVLCARGQV